MPDLEKLARELDDEAASIEAEARFPCGAGMLVDNLIANKAIGYRHAARMVRAEMEREKEEDCG